MFIKWEFFYFEVILYGVFCFWKLGYMILRCDRYEGMDFKVMDVFFGVIYGYVWDLYMLIRYIDFFDVLVFSFVLYEKFVLLLNFELVVKRNVLKMFVYFKNCLDCYCNVDFY